MKGEVTSGSSLISSHGISELATYPARGPSLLLHKLGEENKLDETQIGSFPKSSYPKDMCAQTKL